MRQHGATPLLGGLRCRGPLLRGLGRHLAPASPRPAASLLSMNERGSGHISD